MYVLRKLCRVFVIGSEQEVKFLDTLNTLDLSLSDVAESATTAICSGVLFTLLFHQ